MRTFLFIFSAALLFACNEPAAVKKEPIDAKGKWESVLPWDNNYITLTVRPDSIILFQAKKSFCPGTKYFVSAGKWQIENDSFLVMKRFTGGKKHTVKELFP